MKCDQRQKINIFEHVSNINVWQKTGHSNVPKNARLVGGRGRVRRHQPEEAVKRFEDFPVKISFIEPTPEDPKIISGFSQKQQHGQQILSRNQCRNCFSLFQFESTRLIKFWKTPSKAESKPTTSSLQNLPSFAFSHKSNLMFKWHNWLVIDS